MVRSQLDRRSALGRAALAPARRNAVRVEARRTDRAYATLDPSSERFFIGAAEVSGDRRFAFLVAQAPHARWRSTPPHALLVDLDTGSWRDFGPHTGFLPLFTHAPGREERLAAFEIRSGTEFRETAAILDAQTGAEAQRPDHALSAPSRELAERDWTSSPGSTSSSPPRLADGRVLFTLDGALFLGDPTGQDRVRVETEGPALWIANAFADDAPFHADEPVLVRAVLGDELLVRRFDPETLSLRPVDLDPAERVFPTGDPDVVVVVEDYCRLVRLDVVSGAWSVIFPPEG